jgi:hypothetical protein
MQELIAGIHAHTTFSDGSGTHAQLAQAAMKAGLDVLITTDHNVLVQGLDGYLQKGRKRMLLLTGEEVHDQTRRPGAQHMLVMGANRELAKFASDPQELIKQAKSSNALSFIAHPNDIPLPHSGEKDFPWTNWNITGFTGIELWNQLSEFKDRSPSRVKALFHVLFPAFYSLGPTTKTLELWDQLLLSKTHPVVAIAGVDAHANKKHLGPFSRKIFPYEWHFKSLRTHILTPKPLSGELNQDRQMVYDALRQGHCYLGYDLPHPSKGFRFTCNTEDGLFWMGDTVSARSGLTFQARLPMRTHVRLIKDGKVIKEHYDREVLTHITKDPGIYRVEVYIDYLNRHRGWIFSNPIYATP